MSRTATIPIDDTAGAAHADRRRVAIVLTVLAAVLVLVILGRLAIGSSSLGWPTATQPFIWYLRESRVVISVIVGVALAISGVALQALLRNPLAEPFILGLSTGAAAGMMAQSLVLVKLGLGVTLAGNPIGALVGAGVSMAIVFLASRRHGVLDPLGLLLTGVVLSTINGAIIMLLNYLVGPGGIRNDLAQWMMGNLNTGVGRPVIVTIAVVAALGMVLLFIMGRAMDVATLSDTEAQSLGVNLGLLRTLLFAVASILAAGAVMLAGPVAFVGLICPHLARVLLGPSHRPLVIASAMLGATLIVAADAVSALLAHLHIGLLPIGIFTAMIGGPVFLWMLHPKLGRGEE